ENAVRGGDAGRAVHVLRPDPRPPLPRIRGVEPAQWLVARRARRLMQPRVAIDRESEIRPERRMSGLVRQKLRLRGQRQALEIVPAADAVEAIAPESVGGEDVGQAGAQLGELQGTQLVDRVASR